MCPIINGVNTNIDKVLGTYTICNFTSVYNIGNNY